MSDADRRGDTRRTFIGSVVCIDLVGYSKRSVSQQRSIKDEFNRILTRTLRAVPEEDRVILDTGDGASITFLSDPESSFATALQIRDAMNAAAAALGGEQGPIRIGINFGSIKFTRDLNGRPNVVGDSMSGAARIASHASPGQIVISHSFHAMVSRLSDGNATLFRPEGVVTDRSGHSDAIFSVADTAAPDTRRVHPGAATLRINRRAQGAIAAVLVLMGVAAVGAWWLVRRPERAPEVTASAPPTEAPRAEVPPAPQTPALSVPPRAQEPQAQPAQKPPERVVERRIPEPRPEPPPKARESGAAVEEGSSPSPSRAPRELDALAHTPKDAATTLGSAVRGAVDSIATMTKGLARPIPESARSQAPSASPATPVSREQPRFPVAAANEGLQRGTVHARLEIDAAGNVTEVHILSADPPRAFNREAIRALRNWRFDSGDPNRTYDVSLEFER